MQPGQPQADQWVLTLTGGWLIMRPYLFSALRRLPLGGYDPRMAGKRGWVSCWLPAMVQVAFPPASEARLDR